MTESCPLNQLPPGCRARVERLCECPRARGRLCAMGLTPGAEIEVFSSGGGPCRVRVRGSSLSLGEGLASKVLARQIVSDQASPVRVPDSAAA